MEMNSRWSAQWMFACIVLAASIVTGAEGSSAFATHWNEIRARQPTGLTLELKLTKRSFYQGEIIDATLVFANASTNSYRLWTGTYDRSGRIRDISFTAISESGEPVTDPLQWYYTGAGRCFIGGGLGGEESLGTWSITLPANQWLRFDKPGKYQLYARSNRLAVELVSDIATIEITCLPSEQVRQILAQAQSDPQKGIERLRYLQTPAARQALLKLIGRENGFDAAMGLLEAPDLTNEAVAVLSAVEEPDVAINENYLCLYGALKSFSAQQSATGDVQQITHAIQTAATAGPRRTCRQGACGAFEKKGERAYHNRDDIAL